MTYLVSKFVLTVYASIVETAELVLTEAQVWLCCFDVVENAPSDVCLSILPEVNTK